MANKAKLDSCPSCGGPWKHVVTDDREHDQCVSCGYVNSDSIKEKTPAED